MQNATALIQITLPFPPDTNHMYRYAGGMVYMTNEARRFKQTVRAMVQRHYGGLVVPARTPLFANLQLFMRANRLNRLDVDGLIKPLQDAVCEAFAPKINDAWIRRLLVTKQAIAKNHEEYAVFELGVI